MYKNLKKEELLELKKKLIAEYEDVKAKGLKLDMSRGKPGPDQLDLSNEMVKSFADSGFASENGTDCRNYGILDGISEAKKLFMPMLGVSENEIIIGGNSSLQLMYDTVIRSMVLGNCSSGEPWVKAKFLCPVPGYDRHFGICQSLGIDMINIPMDENGPDMDMIEKLVSEDASIKGIWCVPLYSNPDGIVYSDDVVKRFAALSPKAPDFRIFWDNAYCVHHLTDNHHTIPNILDECKKANNANMVYIFASTSKISFPGSGVSVMAASEENITAITKLLGIATISYDKINQLKHARYFKNLDGIMAHMEKLKSSLAPKFSLVLEKLDTQIAGLGILEWVKPEGGYFVSVNTLDGCAKRTVALLKDAGVVMTGAGATFPYGKDPADKNIRIAPTYPPLDELAAAMDLFCLCVKIASVEKLLGE